jgi:ribosome biogenesis GTPase
MKGIKNTNPVAVGDWVHFELGEDGTGYIQKLEPRSNYIIRKSVNLSKRTHIIAANMDQSLLIVSLAPPRTLLGFIDRFLVTSEAYEIPTLIVVNKLDLLDEDDQDELQYLKVAYNSAGYEVLFCSATENDGIEELRLRLEGKTTLVSGNSGVGKSSLINSIDESLNLKTKSLSQSYQLGQHSTTFAELFPLSFGGEIIDTPGIKGFGLFDIEKQQLSHYFPDIFKLSSDCRFHNCQHHNEPNCAVRKAFEEQELAPTRYENYLKILQGDDDETVYR